MGHQFVPAGHICCYACRGDGRITVYRPRELIVVGSDHPVSILDSEGTTCPTCGGTGALPLPKAHGADHD